MSLAFLENLASLERLLASLERLLASLENLAVL